MRVQAGISTAVSGVWDNDICDSVFSGAYFRVSLYPTGRGDPVCWVDSSGGACVYDGGRGGELCVSAQAGDVAADQICDRVITNNVRRQLGGDNGESFSTKIVYGNWVCLGLDWVRIGFVLGSNWVRIGFVLGSFLGWWFRCILL